MDILLLAPQPFFIERGTPIAVDQVVKTLSKRGEKVDLLTIHLGEDGSYPGVRIFRTRDIPFIRSLDPGFSINKIITDFLVLVKTVQMVRAKHYDLIHAIEESAFIALFVKLFFHVQYIYDMDSSLVDQILDRFPAWLRFTAPLLRFFEKQAVKNAIAVAPVCQALADDVQRYHPKKAFILHDVSLLRSSPDVMGEDLRDSLGISGPLLMYIGNLEHYQGIDLMVEGFHRVAQEDPGANLVIIGGNAEDVHSYQGLVDRLGLSQRVFLLGPRPLKHLDAYLAQADILLSPRIKGTNTPMKVYSYLDSGKPVVATNLPTHTQVMDGRVAVLTKPNPEDFARGIQTLLKDPILQETLGSNARQLIQERHSYPIFANTLNKMYDWIKAELVRKGYLKNEKSVGYRR